MPTYTYICGKCSKKFELFSYLADYTDHPPCEYCSSKKTDRSYIDDLCVGFVKKADSELNTIGDLANRNRDRMSQDEKISLHDKHNSYKEKESHAELPKGMNRMTKPKIKNKWY